MIKCHLMKLIKYQLCIILINKNNAKRLLLSLSNILKILFQKSDVQNFVTDCIRFPSYVNRIRLEETVSRNKSVSPNRNDCPSLDTPRGNTRIVALKIHACECFCSRISSVGRACYFSMTRGPVSEILSKFLSQFVNQIARK